MNNTLFLDTLLGSTHKQFSFYCFMEDCSYFAIVSLLRFFTVYNA